MRRGWIRIAADKIVSSPGAIAEIVDRAAAALLIPSEHSDTYTFSKTEPLMRMQDHRFLTTISVRSDIMPKERRDSSRQAAGPCVGR